ncbi:MAG TPA: helix-turn-helix domain-containing protein [Candidatus Limnocylindrales bacterium]|nr:helix-turn-helix domain-containing protein [Candidatus Limnocylindrales bacterium]
MDDELLAIGRFARLTGLSIGALRHYDELDILRPAEVDRFTGYRRYRRTQLDTARAIARLRDLEVPLDEIRLVLAADDPADQRRRVAEHRSRIEARINRLGRILHVLGQLSAGREPLVSDAASAPTAPELDAAAHRRLGVDLFNHTWTLIEKPDRTPAETDEMIHAAHASRHHWSKAGTTVNLARGEWQIARVYSVLGRAEPAQWHAARCLAYVEAAVAAGEAEDWDLAAAYESLARAASVAGDRDAAATWRDRARAALAAIADPADRELIEGDLATIPL